VSETAKVRAIKPEADADLVAALESWLEDAKRGDLVGCVLLGNRRGDEIQHHSVGRMKLGDALAAFELFKLKAFDVARWNRK
jgi:hypothetical protein